MLGIDTWSSVPSKLREELSLPVVPLFQAWVDTPEEQVPVAVWVPEAPMVMVPLLPLPEASFSV